MLTVSFTCCAMTGQLLSDVHAIQHSARFMYCALYSGKDV